MVIFTYRVLAADGMNRYFITLIKSPNPDPSRSFSTLLSLKKSAYSFNVRLVDIDDFVAKLWEIHVAVKKEGYVQACKSDMYSIIMI